MIEKELKELNLAELEAMYRLIDDGIYDGDSTEQLHVEARGSQTGHEICKEQLRERLRVLQMIGVFINYQIAYALITQIQNT